MSLPRVSPRAESCRDAAFPGKGDTPVPREEWVRNGGEPWPVKWLCSQRTSVLVSSLSCLWGFPSEAWDRAQQGSILVSFPSTQASYWDAVPFLRD